MKGFRTLRKPGNTLPVGKTCCSTVAPASTHTIVDTGESGRVIQFALKVRF